MIVRIWTTQTLPMLLVGTLPLVLLRLQAVAGVVEEAVVVAEEGMQMQQGMLKVDVVAMGVAADVAVGVAVGVEGMPQKMRVRSMSLK